MKIISLIILIIGSPILWAFPARNVIHINSTHYGHTITIKKGSYIILDMKDIPASLGNYDAKINNRRIFKPSQTCYFIDPRKINSGQITIIVKD